jgi:hypothetical protein
MKTIVLAVPALLLAVTIASAAERAPREGPNRMSRTRTTKKSVKTTRNTRSRKDRTTILISRSYGEAGVLGSLPLGSPYGVGTSGDDEASLSARGLATIPQARITREQARQAAIDTARKQLAFEAELELLRPTAQDVRDRELAADLTRARRNPPAAEILSGKALNDLLRSIQANSSLNRGPSISLDEDTLKGITLAVPASRGNVALLKKEKLDWPLPLQDARFDQLRKKLSGRLAVAVVELKDNDLQASTIKDATALHKALLEELDSCAGELSPSEFIQCKRFVNQLGDAVKALSEPKVANYFNNTWTARGKTVAELAGHLKKKGLEFAAAGPGDEPAYLALYQSLRAFEAGVQQATRK